MRIRIYTDGSVKDNPGPGGWGAVILFPDRTEELRGGSRFATNNQMEMMACIRALRHLAMPSLVQIFTDSQYVQKGMSTWLRGWKKNNWRSQKGAVKNKDLWLELDSLTQKHDVVWTWVRGHSGDRHNERADALANEGRLRSTNESTRVSRPSTTRNDQSRPGIRQHRG